MMDYDALRSDVMEPSLTTDDLRNISLRLLMYNKTLNEKILRARTLLRRQKRCISQQNKIIYLSEDAISNLLQRQKEVEKKYNNDLLELKVSLQSAHSNVKLAIDRLKLYDLEDTIGSSHIRLLEMLKRKGRGKAVVRNGASSSQVQSKINKNHSRKKRNDGYTSAHGKRGRPPKVKSDIENDLNKPKKPRGRPPNKENSVSEVKTIKRKVKQTVNESQNDESDYERRVPRKRKKLSLEGNESQDSDQKTPRKRKKTRRILDELREKSKAILHMVHASRTNAQKRKNAADYHNDVSDHDITPNNYDLLVSKCMEEADNPKPVIVLQDVLKDPYSAPDFDREIIENYKYYSCAEVTTADEENYSDEELNEDIIINNVNTPEKENDAEESYDEYCQLSTTTSPRFPWQGPFPPPDYKPDGDDSSD